MPSWALVLCVVVRWLAVGQTRINCPGHLGTGWGLERLSQERVVMSWVTWQSSAVTGTVSLSIWKALQWGSFALAVMLFAALVAVFRPSWQLSRASWILGWGLRCQGMGALLVHSRGLFSGTCCRLGRFVSPWRWSPFGNLGLKVSLSVILYLPLWAVVA